MSQKLSLTSPVGRIVMGSLYTPSTTDAEGKPLIVKNGPNAGQPRVSYWFHLAVQKNPGETHWSQTEWGKQIWAVGHAAFPNIAASPSFAWKVEDGDSQLPNKKGRKPCDNEGYPGNWIIKLSAGFAPKVYQQEGVGFVQLVQKDFVKPGYFVEVNFTVEGNGSSQQAGVYLNHSLVCFRGYGQEIVTGPNVADAGFGKAPMPMGASATPLASTTPMPQAAPLPAPALSVPVAVMPNPGFLQVPMPAAPAPAKQMTAAANGLTYQQYIAAGWTDVQLVQNGLMLA